MRKPGGLLLAVFGLMAVPVRAEDFSVKFLGITIEHPVDKNAPSYARYRIDTFLNDREILHVSAKDKVSVHLVVTSKFYNGTSQNLVVFFKPYSGTLVSATLYIGDLVSDGQISTGIHSFVMDEDLAGQQGTLWVVLKRPGEYYPKFDYPYKKTYTMHVH